MKKRPDPRRAGYVALVGRTNVGKSTFLNALLEAKIAIVSAKPQTTRRKVLGIKTTGRGQAVFFDCPGVHKPHFKLNELMMKEVRDALHDADLVLYFVDVSDPRPDEFVLSMLAEAKKPVFLAINKIDTLNRARVLERIQAWKDAFPWKEIVPLSALRGDNLDLIEELIFRYLPEGEDLYPAEETTLQSQAHYVGELVREKVLERVEDELPFTTTLRVEEIRDRGEVVYVRAEIWVESPAQKKIVVGRQGGLVKCIGTAGRASLEEYFGKKVFLDLFVKVVPGWRNSPEVVREIFG
ncbi:MAG TPA: GTPase Era [Candidatus Aminicenantes bacterium]|nr:GTPase Era [Candidatus Aminicenantes bacterium]